MTYRQTFTPPSNLPTFQALNLTIFSKSVKKSLFTFLCHTPGARGGAIAFVCNIVVVVVVVVVVVAVVVVVVVIVVIIAIIVIIVAIYSADLVLRYAAPGGGQQAQQQQGSAQQGSRCTNQTPPRGRSCNLDISFSSDYFGSS